MDWFVADTHFGHEKMRSRRGFASVSEMDEALIAAWNARVGETDDVFIAGDLICHSERPAAEYLRRLKGRKHLAVGNHDRAWMREVARPGRFVTVGHYPMMDWFRRRHGGHLVYGHIHDSRKEPYYAFLQTVPQAYNAGVNVNGMRPSTLEELIANTAARRERQSTARRLTKGTWQ